MDTSQMIAELQSLVDTGTRVPGFRRKVMVDIDRLMSLAADLSTSLPANIQEADEVLRLKETYINQASLEAQRIKGSAEQDAAALISAAQREHEAKVDETEIVKAAEVKAEEIKDSAMMEAQQIVHEAQRRAHRIISETESVANGRRDGANQYAREVLSSLEEQLAESLGQVRRGIDALRLEEVEADQIQERVPV